MKIWYMERKLCAEIWCMRRKLLGNVVYGKKVLFGNLEHLYIDMCVNKVHGKKVVWKCGTWEYNGVEI